jgi:hypothetical protein
MEKHHIIKKWVAARNNNLPSGRNSFDFISYQEEWSGFLDIRDR